MPQSGRIYIHKQYPQREKAQEVMEKKPLKNRGNFKKVNYSLLN